MLPVPQYWHHDIVGSMTALLLSVPSDEKIVNNHIPDFDMCHVDDQYDVSVIANTTTSS